MIPDKEWKALIKDADEKKIKKKVQECHLVQNCTLHFEFNTFNFI